MAMGAQQSQSSQPTDWGVDAYEELIASVPKAAVSAPSENHGNPYAWRDSFNWCFGEQYLVSLTRTPELVQELSLVVEGFSSSLTVSGFPLAQCVPEIARMLMWLALDHDSNKLKGMAATREAWMQQQYEEMVDVLIEAVEDDDLMVAAPDHHLPFLAWAFTWMMLHLLQVEQQQIMSKEGMESQASWFDLLDCLWPDDGTCSQTKRTLDYHRRLLLFECGHQAQALAGFELPDADSNLLFLSRGFEKCFFLQELSEKYRLLRRYDQAMDWSLEAEKAAGHPELKSHKHWPYIHLSLLGDRVGYLHEADWAKLASEAEAKYLSAARKVDLRLQFDHSELDKIKFTLLKQQAGYLTKTTSKSCFRGLTAIPELSSDQLASVNMMDMLGIEEGSYWYLRGLQLLLLGQVEDATNAFSSILPLLPESVEPVAIEHMCSALCTPLDRPFSHGRMLALKEVDVLAGCWNVKGLDPAHTIPPYSALLAGLHDYFRALYQLRSSSSDQGGTGDAGASLWALLAGLHDYFSSLYWLRSSSSDQGGTGDAGASLWQSWHDLLGNYHGWDLHCTQIGLVPSNLASSIGRIGLILVYAFQMDLGVEVAWPPPPHLDIAGTSSKQAFIDDCACRVLVYAEQVRPYSVPVVEEEEEEDLVFPGLLGPNEPKATGEEAVERDWEMVTQARLHCGSDTVFLHYLGYVSPAWVSIMHPDGAASCLLLPGLVSSEAAVRALEKTAESIISSMRTDESQQQHQLQQQEPGSSKSKLLGDLEWLYDMMIRPVFEHLGLLIQGQPMNPQCKLVIVSTGYFSNVPFHILRNKETGKHLFEEVTLSVTPSFRLLHQCQKRYEMLQKRPLFGPGPGAAVAIGAPAYKNHTRALPGSGREVKEICELFKATGGRHQVQMLLEEEATVDAFLRWTVDKTKWLWGRGTCSQAFIHVAAHARVDQHVPRGALELAHDWNTLAKANGHAPDPDRPSTSQPGLGFPAMLLSEGTTSRLMAIDDEEASLASRASGSNLQELDSRSGFLPSHWIFNSGKEWSAYMLVLSCCDSGTGQVSDHGTLNLGRAFMFQGIPCCILSLWPVDDTATGDLMLLFYKAMREGQDVSSALRSAMLTMLHKCYSLRHLAPFVVCGVPTVRLPPEMRASACTSNVS